MYIHLGVCTYKHTLCSKNTLKKKKDFIYLRERESMSMSRERGKGRGRSRLPVQPNMGLGPRPFGSWPELRQMLIQLSHQAPHRMPLNEEHCSKHKSWHFWDAWLAHWLSTCLGPRAWFRSTRIKSLTRLLLLEPASPSACVFASLIVSLMNK